jgi:hypothetical protein
MGTINISLPDSLQSFVDEQVKQRGYGSGGEYVRVDPQRRGFCALAWPAAQVRSINACGAGRCQLLFGNA